MNLGLERLTLRGGAASAATTPPPIDQRFTTPPAPPAPPAKPAPATPQATAAPEEAVGPLAFETKNPKWVAGDKTIVRVELGRLTFSGFVAAMRRAETARVRERSDNRVKYLMREVIKATWRATDASGAAVTITDDVLLNLPRTYGAQAQRLLGLASLELPGKVLTDGDGIDTPVLYQLGTPLKMGTDGAQTITELEFVAQSYGDIEDVLTCETEPEQTLALIARCARPVGSVSLVSLPSWALDQITLVDGLEIGRAVLPRFLG